MKLILRFKFMPLKYLFILLAFIIEINLFAQNATVFGVVKNIDDETPIDFVTVVNLDDNNVVESNTYGEYSIKVKALKGTTLKFSRVGYKDTELKIEALNENTKRYINIYLASIGSDLDVVITASRIDDQGMVREEVTEFKKLPTASGNFESILPSIALGVNAGSGGELSAQYNVRGGNYDENLVYINDFEVFRPQLIRAGQQEGLSFPNIDLIKDVAFSSGGYESSYGNKMSSVLDVKYKRADKFKSSLSGSLLGLSGHVEGSKRLGPNAYHKLRYLIGTRYKTNKYLLGSLDVKGEYVPDFFDVQGYFTYDVSKSIQVGLLTNYNSNVFNFAPESRSTTLGLLTNAIRFTTAYEGGEKDRFIHGLVGTSISYIPDRNNNPFFIKWMASRYSGSEQENFDILGYYRLSQIESNLGSDNLGEEIAVLGTGTQHRYARNYLYNQIYNSELRSGIELSKGKSIHFIQAGLKVQSELYEDLLNEWERLDSADYSLPYSGNEVSLSQTLKSKNELRNNKYNLFVQDEYSYQKDNAYKLFINLGTRLSYLDLGDEWLVSPRAMIRLQPLNSTLPITFKIAGGVYYQEPYYREFRRKDGTLNTDLKSQKSIHLVGGMDYEFMWKGRSKKPFKLITEVYYKKMENLISYNVDNVRIAYSGENDAKGYATGIDLRINGEFVKDAESWVNLSFLRTRESLYNVQHLTWKDTALFETKDVPRPTDRFFTLNMFFQDYLPKNKNIKANINYSFATGLPFGIKDDNVEARNTFRYNPYQRLDIGFGYQIWDAKRNKTNSGNPFRNTKDAWLSLEVYNIMGITNTASITWIKTITNTQYAINNNLTSRRLNLRLRVEF